MTRQAGAGPSSRANAGRAKLVAIPIARLRCPRAALLTATALQVGMLTVIILARPARAQSVAPTILPSGGEVIGGVASIARRGNALIIDQTTQSAAINWQSFSVGSRAAVGFHVPTPQAITINRVIGPDPSVIAGRITSNGRVVIANQSGIVFANGAQVDVNTLIASAPGITAANAIAGRLVFDQPARPGGAVVNNANITVRQAGLAALVGPTVANNGVISARLGHVVLAGAAAATVDFYGDGLLSFDVTKQVTRTASGAAAIVTNTGTIVANGGTVTLSAAAVDGLVTNLVEAGGNISAPSVGARRGSIVIDGTGGSVTVEGQLAARGDAAGTTGGTIEVNATGGVTVAAGARLDASGQTGGGVVAVGTTIARAQGGPSVAAPAAQTTTVSQGSTLAADALDNGDGGHVTVLSLNTTDFAGYAETRGGQAGGNGGAIELSGGLVQLSGAADALAPHGATGSILLDPGNLDIANGGHDSVASGQTYTADSKVDPGSIEALSGDVTLSAVGNITIDSSLDFASNPGVGGFTLLAGGSLLVNQPVSGTAGIEFGAGLSSLGGSTGGITIDAAVTTTGSVAGANAIILAAGSEGITLNANLDAQVVDLSTTGGGITQISTAIITAGQLQSSDGVTGDVGLFSNNSIAAVGSFDVTGGSFRLDDLQSLQVNGNVKATSTNDIGLAVGGLVAGGGSLQAPGGTVEIEAYPATDLLAIGAAGANTASIDPVELAAISTGDLILKGAGVDVAASANLGSIPTLDVEAGTGTLALTGGTLTAQTLLANAAAITQTSGILVATTLTTSAGLSGGVTLDGGTNEISTISALGLLTGDLRLLDGQAVTVIGSVQAPNILLNDQATGTAITLKGTLVTGAAGTLDLSAPNGGVGQTGGSIVAGTLLSSGGIGGLLDLSGGSNTIGALGSLTATGGLRLQDTTLVTVSGLVSVGGGNTLAIADDGFTLASGGSLSAPSGLVELGPVTSGGTVLLGTTGAAGIIAPGDLSAITAGTLRLGTTDIAGTVVGTITAGGAVHATGVTTLELDASGGVSIAQPLTLAASGVLTGSAGSFDIVGVGNVIPNLGSLDAGTGGITLDDGTALDLAGPVTGGAVLISDSATGAAITVSGVLTGSTSVELDAAGGSIEGPPSGGVVTPLLTSATIADGVTLNGASDSIVSIGTLQPSTGDVVVHDTAALGISSTTVIGASAGNVTLSDSAGGTAIAISGGTIEPQPGGTLDLSASNGGISQTAGTLVTGAAGTLDLSAPNGGVGQTGGSIVAGTLLSSGGIGGLLDLSGGSNTIGALGSLTATGGLRLQDTTLVTVSGLVSVGGGNTLAIADDGFTLASGGSLSAPSGLVELGPVTSGGTVLLGTTGAAGIIAPGDLSAITAGTLRLGTTDIAGTVVGTITAGGAVHATGVTTLELDASGGVSIAQPLTLAASGVLTGSAGSFDIVGVGNVIPNLGSLDAGTGGITLDDGTALDLAGPVTGGAVLISDSATGAAITVSGVLTGSTSVELDAAGGSIEGPPSGGVVTPLLTSATIADGVTLNGASDSIVSIGTLQPSTGDVVVHDTAALGISSTTVIGASAGNVTLSDSAGGTAIAISGGTIEPQPGGTLDLSASNGGISQTAGTLVTGAAGTLDLSAPNGGVGQTGGSIVAGTLDSGQGVGTGGLSLAGGSNTIGALGSLTSGGTLALLDTEALQVTGKAQGANVSLQADGITLPGGALIGTGTVLLNPDGMGVSESGAGLISAGTLALPAGPTGAVQLLGNNTILALGSVAATGTLVDISVSSNTMDVVGPLQASTATLTDTAVSEALSFSGLADVTGTLVLSSAGGIDQSTGTIIAPALIGAADGNVSLDGSNTIATLGGFAVTSGGFGLNDQQSLTVSGSLVSSGITLDVASVGGLTLAGSVDAGSGGVLDVSSLGPVAQSGGFVRAGVVQSAFGVGSLTLAVGGDSLAELGTLLSGGAVDVVSVPSLGVVGAVSGSVVTLSAATLGVSGDVSASALVSLDAGGGGLLLSGTVASPGGVVDLSGVGGVTQSGGAVVAGTLRSGSGFGGSVELGSDLNSIGVVGLLSAPGQEVSITDAQAVTVAGPVEAARVAVTDRALGTALLVTGTVDGGGTVALSAPSGTVQLAGSVEAPGTLDLSGGTVTQSGGTVVAGTLLNTGSLGELTLTSSSIQGLGQTGVSSLAASGSVSITDATLLTIGGLSADTVLIMDAAGVVIAGRAGGTHGVTLISSGGGASSGGVVSVTGSLDAGSGTLDVTASGGFVESGSGSVLAPVLTSSGGIGGSGVSLYLGRNDIAELGGLTASGGVTIADPVALTQAGVVSAATGGVVLSDGAAGGPALTLDGTIMGSTIALSSTAAGITGAAIVQPGSGVLAGLGGGGTTLSATASSGSIALLGTANLVASLSGQAQAGGFGLNDQQSLTVSGSLVSSGITLDVASVGGLTLAGSVDAGSGGVLDVSSLGPVAQSGGFVRAGVVQSAFGVGSLTLAVGGDSLAELGTLLSGGAVDVVSVPSLGVVGAVSGSVVTLSAATLGVSGDVSASALVSLDAGGGGLLLSGTVASPGGVVDLSGVGGVTQSGGAVVAGTLRSGSGFGGSVELGSDLNSIGVVGLLSAPGQEVSITDAQAVTVAGPVEAARVAVTDRALGTALLVTGTVDGGGTVALSAPSGTVQLAGSVEAPGTLDLSGGTVTQSGGTVVAGTLLNTGSLGELTLTSSSIQGLGQTGVSSLAASGSVSITDATLLTIGGLSADTVLIMDAAGVVIAGRAGGTHGVTLISSGGGASSGGVVSVTGSLDAGSGTLDVTASGGFVESGSGSVLAPVLTSSGGIGGSGVSLYLGRNDIAELGGLTASGGVTIADPVALTQAGVVSAATGGVVLSDGAAGGPALTLDGTIMGSTIALSSTAAGITGAAIVQPGSGVLAGLGGGGTTLSATASSGSIALLGTANLVASLSGQAQAGGFGLNDQQSLTVSGSLVSSGITLDVASVGGLTLAGSVDAGSGGVLDVSSLGPVAQSGGFVRAGVVQSAFGVGSLTLAVGGDSLAELGTLLSGGAVDVVSVPSLGVVGAVSGSVVTLSAATLGVSGDVSASALVSLDAGGGGLLLSGTVASPGGVVDLSGVGGVTQSGGAVVAGTLRSGSGFGGSVELGSDLNSIGVVGLLSAPGQEVSITDAQAVTVAGPVEAARVAVTDRALGTALLVTGTVDGGGTVALSAPSGTVQLAGSVEAPGTLDLSGGTVTQSGGTVVAGTLLNTGSLGELTLTSSSIQGLGQTGVSSLAASGSVSITDATLLTIGGLSADTVLIMDAAGVVIAGRAGGTHGVTLISSGGGASSGGVVSVTGSLDAGSGTLDVTASGGFVESGSGSVLAPVLTSSGGIGGSGVSLYLGRNDIAELGGLTASGGVTIADPVALTQAGVVSAATGGVVLSDGAAGGPALTLDGTIMGSTIALSSTAAGITGAAIVQPGSGVLAGLGGGGTTLSATASSGSIALLGTANLVASLSGQAQAGGFGLNDQQSLTVSGSLVSSGITLDVASVGGLTLAGSVDAGSGGVLDVSSLGPVAQSGGFVRAGVVQSAFGVGSLTLAVGGDSLAELGTLLSGGAVDVVSVPSLGVVGAVSGSVVTLSAATLGVSGDVSASALVSLDAGGGGLLLSGTVASPGGVVDLSGVGGVTQSGGAVVAGTLRSGSGFGGSVELGSDLNSIGVVGLLSAPGQEVSITDAQAVTVAGPVEAARVAVTDRALGTALLVTGTVDGGGTVALSAPSGTVQLAGSVEAPGTLDLSGGTVTQSGGTVVAGTLLNTGSLGELTLTSSSIQGLGQTGVSSLAASGSVSITDATLLTIGGLSADTVLIMDAAGVVIAGRAGGTHGVTLISSGGGASSGGVVSVTGSLDAGSGTLDVTASGGFVESGSGSVLAPVLTSSGGIGGSGVSLYLGRNDIAELGGLTASGGVTIADPVALTQAGVVSAATGGVVLSDGAAGGPALTLDGTIMGSTIALSSTAAGITGAAIVQPGSGVLAGLGGGGTTLSATASSGSIALLGTANLVASLSGQAQAGTFSFNDATPVAITNPLFAAGTVALTDTASGAAIAVDASLTSRTEILLTAGAGGSGSASQAAIAIASAINAPTVSIASRNSGIGTAVLESTGGTVTGNQLLGSIASGEVNLGEAGNAIAVLPAFSAPGQTLVLADSVPLTITGPVVLGSFSLHTTQPVILDGNLDVTNTWSLSSSSTVQRIAGLLQVGTIEGSAGHLADFGIGDLVGTLGPFVMSGSTLALGNAQSLAIAGPIVAGYLAISAVGEVTVTGNIFTDGLPASLQVGTVPSSPGSFISAIGPGAVIDQTGNTTVAPINAANATLRLQLPLTGGSIVLSNLQGPALDLILGLQGGAATGRIAVNSLTVLGGTGSATLTGTVAAVAGTTAAQQSNILPRPNGHYTLNNCPIKSVACVVLPIALVIPANPLNELLISVAPPQNDDLEILLPGIARKDY